MKKGFYLVGGAVRDSLLGMEPKDRDYVAVGYSEKEMLSLGFKPVGKSFPVFLKNGEEYALPRTERSSGPGYKDFKCSTAGVTLEEDLLRRDLTINAMAISPDGELIDPYGGREDLENGILRHTSDAFSEDPLRVLRVARFCARFPEFKVHEETARLIKKMKPLLSSLTKERVFMEMKKALSEKSPENFFMQLEKLNVLDIVFPELYEMSLIEHKNVHHMEGSLFNHAILVLKAASGLSSDPVTRYAALYHDIGKLVVFNENGDFHGHDGYDVVSKATETLKNRYSLPNEYSRAVLQSGTFHHRFHYLDEMNNNKIARMIRDKQFPRNQKELSRFIQVSVADEYGRVQLISGPEKTLSLDEALFFFENSGYFEKGERQFKSEYATGKALSSHDVINWKEKFLCCAFDRVKSLSAKEFLEKNPGASVERIQQYISQKSSAAVSQCKELF